MSSADANEVRRRRMDRGARCQRHGIVLDQDGACRLCAAEHQYAVRSRLVALSGAVALALGAVAHFQTEREPPEQSAKPKGGEVTPRPTVTDLRARAEMAWADALAVKEQAAKAEGEQDSSAEAWNDKHVSVEDVALGVADPRVSVRLSPPPLPPRAPVDPKPALADDPRDFDLR